MVRFTTPLLVVLTLIIAAVAVFAATNDNKQDNLAQVSIIELKQPESHVSPRYLAIADPNTKTISIISVDVDPGADTHVLSVLPYTKKSQ